MAALQLKIQSHIILGWYRNWIFN